MDKLIQAIRNYKASPLDLVNARTEFYTAKQKDGELAEAFIRRLRTLAVGAEVSKRDLLLQPGSELYGLRAELKKQLLVSFWRIPHATDEAAEADAGSGGNRGA